jgi:hypothetical protein
MAEMNTPAPTAPPISDQHDRQGLTTVLQILRKRQSQEEQNRRKSLRAKGRRVSFAPDDELETRHLFSIVSVLPACCVKPASLAGLPFSCAKANILLPHRLSLVSTLG